MFAAAPRPRFVTAAGLAHPSPEETFELARLHAITRCRAEASRLLRELRLLRKDALAAAPAARRNDPKPPPPRSAAAANAPAAPSGAPPRRRNDPEPVADLTF
jgi:hypothetical protein